MTTFTEVYDATVANTKRPELVTLTKTCVKLATMRAHQVDFFLRDQVFQNLSYTMDTTNPLVTINALASQLANKRAITTLQCLDSSTLLPSEMLEWREYSDFWDKDGELRSSVYTEVGDSLVLRPAVQTGVLKALYYKNPVTSEAGYSSWIADEYVDEIAMWAAGLLWARTGFLEQARVVQELHVNTFKDLLVSSYLIGTVN